MDTRDGRQNSVPHMMQFAWSFGIQAVDKCRTVHVEGRLYTVRTASSSGCNCLIDSLRQCMDVVTCVPRVRKSLMDEFRNAPGRARVTG